MLSVRKKCLWLNHYHYCYSWLAHWLRKYFTLGPKWVLLSTFSNVNLESCHNADVECCEYSKNNLLLMQSKKMQDSTTMLRQQEPVKTTLLYCFMWGTCQSFVLWLARLYSAVFFLQQPKENSHTTFYWCLLQCFYLDVSLHYIIRFDKQPNMNVPNHPSIQFLPLIK